MAWLVNIVPHEAPPGRAAPCTIRQRRDRLLELWSRYIDPAIEGDGDYEDFYEQAIRLEAALTSFGPDNVWLTVAGRDPAVNAGTGEVLSQADLADLPRYGSQPSRRHESVDQPQARLADNYYRYEAFRTRAGRRIELCGYLVSGADLCEVLPRFAADGIRRAFLKVTLNKYAAFGVDLHEGYTANDSGAALFENLDYGAMYLEGGRELILAQEWVPMEYEYRVFVVGQRTVTGAGCVVEYTPLDNDGPAFDPKVRRSRSMKSPVERRADIVNRLTAFADEAVAAFAGEVPDLQDYVIDVALGPGGKPLIVELNPLLNSGLYASRPDHVTSALSRRPVPDAPGGTRRSL